MRFDSPQEEWISSASCACRLWCPNIALTKYLSLSEFEVRPVSTSSAILAHLVADVMMPPHPEEGACVWPKVVQFSGVWRRVFWHNGCRYFGGTCPEDVLSSSLYHHDDHHAMASYLTEVKWLTKNCLLSMKLLECHSVLRQLCCFRIGPYWLKMLDACFVYSICVHCDFLIE
jgi:hypothetical protein